MVDTDPHVDATPVPSTVPSMGHINGQCKVLTRGGERGVFSAEHERRPLSHRHRLRASAPCTVVCAACELFGEPTTVPCCRLARVLYDRACAVSCPCTRAGCRVARPGGVSLPLALEARSVSAGLYNMRYTLYNVTVHSSYQARQARAHALKSRRPRPGTEESGAVSIG